MRPLLSVVTAALCVVTAGGAQAPNYTVDIQATGILAGQEHYVRISVRISVTAFRHFGDSALIAAFRCCR
jgi:hypothetical protein